MVNLNYFKTIYKIFVPGNCGIFDTYEKLLCIKQTEVIYNFNKNKRNIKNKKRIDKLIVSLTSFPGRMHDIHFALMSMLDQTVLPEKIIVWLGEEKYPNKINDLPDILKELVDYGVEFIWRKDLRQYTKLIYSIQEYPEYAILTADDDIYYRKDWLEKIYGEYNKHRNEQIIFAHRVHKIALSENNLVQSYSKWKKEIQDGSISYFNFITGVGGVLYPPRSLHVDFSKYEIYSKLTPFNDDIWFYFMAIINGYKIKAVENGYGTSVFVNPQRELRLTGEPTLAMHNVVGNGNDEQFKNVADFYKVDFATLKEGVNG